MFFNIVSIFPEIITDYIQHGLFSKALEKDLVQLTTWNPRDFSKDKHGRIDDKPFGGGRGMLFQAEPIINTVEEIKKQSDTHVVLVSPHGVPFNQEKAKELQSKNNVTIVCGRYEGIITLRAIMEVIVGEISSESMERMDILPQADGTYLIEGGMMIREINRRLEWDLPTEGPKTLSGLILEEIQTIPDTNVGLTIEGYRLETVLIKDNVIKLAKLEKIETSDDLDEEQE